MSRRDEGSPSIPWALMLSTSYPHYPHPAWIGLESQTHVVGFLDGHLCRHYPRSTLLNWNDRTRASFNAKKILSLQTVTLMYLPSCLVSACPCTRPLTLLYTDECDFSTDIDSPSCSELRPWLIELVPAECRSSLAGFKPSFPELEGFKLSNSLTSSSKLEAAWCWKIESNIGPKEKTILALNTRSRKGIKEKSLC